MKKSFLYLLLSSTLLVSAEAKQFFAPGTDGLWIRGKETAEKGVFLNTADRRTVSRRQFLIDPKAVYKVSGKFKRVKPGKERIYVYLGVKPFDSNNRIVESPDVLLVPGSEIKVLHDLKKGDKVFYSDNAASWHPLAKRPWSIRFHARKDLSDLPNRHWGPGIGKVEKISDKNWKITLKSGLRDAVPKGTLVRQHYHGPGRIYCAASGRTLPQDGSWVEYSGTITGTALHGASLNQFWRGAVRGAVVLDSTPSQVLFKDVKIEKLNGKIDLLPLSRQAAAAAKKPARPLTLVQKIDRSKEAKDLTNKYLLELKDKIDGPHPRLFFSDKDFKRIAGLSQTDPRFQDILTQIKNFADTMYPEEVNEETFYKKYHNKQVFYSNDRFGGPASRCAYLWKLTGERKYLEKGIKILRYGAKWYNKRFDSLKNVEWTCFTRLHALCAYDWMYNDMSEQDRLSIGKDLLRHYIQASDRSWVVKRGLLHKGEGHSWWFDSFYGPPMLKFYTGLVFRKKGINDAKAEELYKAGLSDHVKMLLLRSIMSSGAGSGTGSTVEYAFGDAPYCEWFFYSQWLYMTGRNIASDFPSNGMFPHWLHYAIFTGHDGNLYVHGTGDSWHKNNRIKLNNRYLMLFGRFFPDSPANKIVENWILNDQAYKHPLLYRVGVWNFAGYFPWMPLWFRFPDPHTAKPDKAFIDNMPKSYLFENLGQTYMYSSREKDATHALFTCGAKSLAHKHYDEGNFIIYKGGFLAMDTGTRVYSLKRSHIDYYHGSNYYGASVAHNVVLIRMEGEKFGAWPKSKYAIANHAGMNKTIGGVVRAYECNDFYTYIAGDTTRTYHEDKCKKMIRQFVFVQEDYFVVCDTVESVKPSQTKTWLLHSQKKPSLLSKDIFSFDEEEGRLFCRTFLPKDFKRTVIGGKGQDFFVDGKNFNNIDPDYLKKMAKEGIPDPKWGNYRVELTTAAPTAKVRFLNLIQVGMKKNTPAMVPSKALTERGMDGITFTKKNGDICTVLFKKDGSGGHIRILRNGKVLVDKPLIEKIQKQVPFRKQPLQ